MSQSDHEPSSGKERNIRDFNTIAEALSFMAEGGVVLVDDYRIETLPPPAGSKNDKSAQA